MLRGTSAPALREATRLPLTSGGTTSSEGGRPGFYFGLVGRKTWLSLAVAPGRTLSPSRVNRVAMASPRGGSLSDSCFQSSCFGRNGRASSSSHRSPGPSFTLRVFVNRCAGLLLIEQYILCCRRKSVCVCVCVCACALRWI